MKVLIATGIYPPDIGGPATIINSLVHSLEQRGFRIEVITYADKNVSGDKVHRILKNRPFKFLRYFVKMLILAKKTDIIYVTDVYSVGYFAYLLKRFLGKKYVIRFAGDAAWETATARSWTTDYILDFEKKVYGQKIEKLKERRRLILLQADGVIAVSNFLSTVAEKIGVAKNKIKLIYNSVDWLEEQIDPRAVEDIQKHFTPGSKVIVTACRLMPWKGIDGIIRILKPLQRKFGVVQLLVLGAGPELMKLQRLTAQLALNEQVKFIGKVQQQQVINYLRAANLFILNTNYEGLSHTLLEAMKAEVPIITTNVGGNPEVIEHNQEGLLVEYNNTEQLLAATENIFSNPDLATRLVKNAKTKLAKFNWQENINQTARLLEELK
ncbi:MAG: hypothetical protein C3F02_00395 [Parcubacteria group bacterium]|nr:MAG: hypothetical protein C3F02_00395 [Parcubacteria group bacterium]